MSSYRTTITIPDEEWAAIQQSISDTNNYVARRQAEAERIRRQVEERNREIAAIQAANERAIRGAVNTLESTYDGILRQLYDQTTEEVSRQNEQFSSEIESLLADAKDRERRISDLNSRVEQIAQNVNDAFTTMSERRASQQERACAMSQSLHDLLERIGQLNPNVFVPSGYARLQAMVNGLDANLRSGDYSAANILSQNGILDATRLLGELSVSNSRVNVILQDVRTNAARLEERFGVLGSAADGAVTVEIGEETYEYDYDIAHWSHGYYDTLRTRFSQIQDALRQTQNTPILILDAERLRDELLQLSDALDVCDQQARQELIASAHVCQTAETLHNGLSSSGWELAESGFQNDDDRSPYVMQYHDTAGNNVSVVVAPGESAEKPDFFFEVFSDNPVFADSAKRGIHASLAANGIQIEHAEERNDCQQNPTPADFVRNTVREAREISAHRRSQEQQKN